MADQLSLLYSDGACSGNPGPGGWGFVLFHHEKNKIYEGGGFASQTTNNRMEMTALIEGLKEAQSGKIKKLLILTDSTYVIRGFTQWRHGWKKRDWTTSEGEEVTNRDLWERMEKVSQGLDLKWRYVRGHQGTPGNERVDKIAVAFSKREPIQLLESVSPDKYHFDIFEIPEGEPLPEMKPKKVDNKEAFYLSLVNGVLTRHQDWASCERTVKGQSQAKFKKVQSESEAQEILKKWGYSNGS